MPELIPGPLATLQRARVVCISTRALSELFGGYEAGRANSSWEGRGTSDRSHCGRSAQARHAVSIIDPARTAARFGLTDQADHSPRLAPSPGGGSVANPCRRSAVREALRHDLSGNRRHRQRGAVVSIMPAPTSPH